MKKIVILIVFLVAVKSYSQEPELLDKIWYLHYGILNGEEFEPPMNFEAAINFQTDAFYVFHNNCMEGFSFGVEYENTGGFELVEEIVYVIGICTDPDLINFMGKHYAIYIVNLPKNPFNYTIESDGDNYMLTIENGEGDIAVYGSVPLSQPEFSQLQLTLYPNPVTDVLHINSLDVINTISVFDIYGKVVKTVSDLSSNSSEIDLSRLQNGVYFITVLAENGETLTRKVVKK